MVVRPLSSRNMKNTRKNTNFHEKGIKNGIRITQDIAKGYNEIAQWVGLLQVPKPLLAYPSNFK